LRLCEINFAPKSNNKPDNTEKRLIFQHCLTSTNAAPGKIRRCILFMSNHFLLKESIIKKSHKNMKNLIFLAAAVLLTTTLSAQSETRDLAPFSKLNVSGGFYEIRIEAGNTNSVTIYGKSGADTDAVKTEVKGNALNIAMRNNSNMKASRYKMKITCSQALENVNSSGSTDIVIADPIRTETFFYNISGSGDFTAAFDVQVLKCNFSGSGDMMAKGKADEIHFNISGSSDIDARGLKAQTGKIVVSGSGDVLVNVEGELKQVVSGTGDISNTND
jgi:hypothetical protein